MTTGRPSIWIISPAADLGLLILTPLAIIPLVSWLAATQLTAEAIGLGVFAFASLGHHLPGLMRAYGDADLFAQFRWRFLLAPPLAIGLCWLSFITFRLHGLELLLLLWATWHILMQTYGFMRIYDRKQGAISSWHANWDFAACITVFAAGVVFSDARMYGFAETIALAGGPLIAPLWLAAARLLVGAAAIVILMGYLVVALRARQRVAQANWLKILLLSSTALLYWWSGNLSVHLLVGVAMFDIFHAIQYDAICWYYNRRRAEKGGRGAGVLARLFHARWWALPVYVAAIAAFGGLGLWGRSTTSEPIAQIAMTLFAASAMLHFYYDGFIWKVSQPKTSENLSIEPVATTSAAIRPSRHMAYWGAFAGVVLVLGLLEVNNSAGSTESQRLEALAALTPEVPELQLRIGQYALRQHRYDDALTAATAAAVRRPQSFDARLAMADADYALGRLDDAARAYSAARAIRPADRSSDAQLADIYFRQGSAHLKHADYVAAKESLAQCLQIMPDHIQAHYQAGSVALLTDQPQEAAMHYRRCVELDPNFTSAYNNLGAALYQLDDLIEAADAYNHSIALEPRQAESHYNLALVFISQGDIAKGRRSVLQAASLGQHPSPEVLRAVGL